MSRKRIVIVGGGISGLTAATYLLRSGHEVSILEKTSQCGGLVGSFTKEGFLFDTGPRGLGNAGILVPMLEDLQIDLPLVDGSVSTGIENEIVHYDSRQAIEGFIASLGRLFPQSILEIGRIHGRIRSYSSNAGILNRVPNPFFKNPLEDRRFLFREFLPWLPSFLRVVLKTSMRKETMEVVLDSLTDNASLKDMISQHFFKGTPAGFALGYFENYLDYKYPLGGTGQLPAALESRIRSQGGSIRMEQEVVRIHPVEKKVLDQHGEEYFYDRLLWAADLRSLYRRLEGVTFGSTISRLIEREGEKYSSARTGESVFSLFIGVDETPDYFKGISRGHFIYTPRSRGLGELHRTVLEELKADFQRISRQELFRWLKEFCERNSYEISIPVLKDDSLAPRGKTGLVISVLVDGPLFLLVEKAGWIGEFREKFQEYMLDTLESSVYPGLRKKILFVESATPLTLMKRFATSGGAITGWSLEQEAPVPDNLTGIMTAVKTAIPHVYRAGQWSYSPAGVPIAILTGRIAAAVMGR